MALFSSFGEVNLDALDATITDNAVDIFVYDTRKDSDGGKWRKRTKKTSWYNETLNTATRGSRRDFPAVAVIVAEASKVTIYDGDDPDLPMWMVFISPSALPYNLIPNTSGNVTSITALNGKISLGYSYNYGMGVWDFISEFCIAAWRNNSKIQYAGNIAERNDQKGTIYLGSPYILTHIVNDVAMTVLPNAPIDSATGIPIPTVAIATQNGVSVIKDDGTVVDAVGTTFDVVNSISFDKNNRIICSSGTAGTDQAFFSTFAIPSADLSHVFPGGDNGYYRDGYGSTDLPWYGSTGSASNQSINEVSSYGDYISFGTEDDGSTLNPGLKILSENITTPSEGMLCGVSTSYNTGWMHGDIKGAFLSDTDTTNAGSELITNGTFDTDTTGWTAYNSVISVDSNRLKIDDTANAGGWSSAVQEISTEIGKTYYLTFTYTYSADSLLVGHYAGSYASAGAGTAPTSVTDYGTTSGTYTRMIAATTTTTSIIFTVNNQGVSFVDNITFKEAVQDRSVNNKGLQVFGTITKSAVAGSGATAAELVAYSGWSTSNYLEQPYNSDFNLTSTQDASWIIWFKNTESIETYYHVFDSGYVSNSAEHYWLIGLLGTGDGRPLFRLNGATQQNLNGIGNYLDGSWHQIIVTRTGSGTLISMYIDGKLSSTLSTSPLEITHTSNAKLRIGLRGGTNNKQNTGGYLTQLRFSKSAPSAEQIKKIYEDEKVLFQENAACTLYGSSDAVTALAYDDKTNLLHVGTSSGRSDFKGLRRINNTTTGITTAISASNRLIAEQ